MQNSVNLTGRIARDIEVKVFENGDKVTQFALAVQRNYKNKDGEYDCDFIPCRARNGTADLLFKYFKKGDFCPVTGEIHTRIYEKDGENRTAVFVDISSITFVGGRKNAEQASQETNEATSDGFVFHPDAAEEDLPF
jgi:single-strand DNA-binding protein